MRVLFFLAFVGVWGSVVASHLKIASFNIQIFGKKKMKNEEVVEILVEILSRYDLVLIQEVRDKSQTAIEDLLNHVNKANDGAYSKNCSERMGRSHSKEQYCFFYKSKRVTVIEDYAYANQDDKFERDPYSILISDHESGNNFVVTGVHIKPDDAVAELDHMVEVYETLKDLWATENVLMMGDLNADCGYVRNKDWPEVDLRTDERFEWYIDDNADTTVKNSDCAYDRFVVGGADLQRAVKEAKVFNFEESYGITRDLAEDVSDHYPIEILIDSGALASSHTEL